MNLWMSLRVMFFHVLFTSFHFVQRPFLCLVLPAFLLPPPRVYFTSSSFLFILFSLMFLGTTGSNLVALVDIQFLPLPLPISLSIRLSLYYV